MTEALPEGWALARLSDLSDVRLGRQRSPKNHTGEHMRPYLRAANVTWQGIELSDVKHMSFEPHEAVAYELRPGDILVAEASGSADEVGRPSLWRGEVDGCCFQNTLIRVRSLGMDPAYLHLVLASHAAAGDFGRASRGVGIRHLGRAALADWIVPVPPLQEQRRIVAAAEEHVSRLDANLRLVTDAGHKLERLKSAILRSVMPDPLPVGWKLLRVDEAGTVDLGRQRAPQYHSGENMRPYLRAANVQEDRIDLSDVMHMDFPVPQVRQYELEVGDILLIEGHSPELVGRPAMLRQHVEGLCFTKSLMRFRPFDFVNAEFALLVFLRHLYVGRFQREARITTNIGHMAAVRFKSVEFPVPPMDEQMRVVERVRRELSLVEKLRDDVLRTKLKASVLRRAVQRAATAGDLTRRDPRDEPAADLLARIAADRPAPAARGRKKSGA